ncbi:MAG: hypothetical protein EBT69_09070 [Verrucomicrobia bacterium]|nr:hypothetical protein [Verrucomicrobiota bacterium]
MGWILDLKGSASIVMSMKPTSSTTPQIIRVVGYGLLAFAGIDLLFQLLANPFGGALQAFRFSSGLVDRTPVPLLALGVLLAFPRPLSLPIERTFMRILSFVPYLYAAGFLAVIAAALITGNRLIVVAEQQIAAQSQAQMRQLETTVDRVKSLNASELSTVVANFNQQNRTTLQSGEFLNKLGQQTEAQKAQLKEGTARALQGQRRSMTLELLKVLLGAAAGSGIMFLLGGAASWARSPGGGQG